MGGRSLKIFGILLLCMLSGACSRRIEVTSDELITDDYDINIYEDTLSEDIDVVEHKDMGMLNHEEPGMTEGDYNDIVDYEETIIPTAGSIINTKDFNKEILDSLFYIEELNQDIIGRINGRSYKEGADIPYSDLRYIGVLHIGFDGLTRMGELIVHRAIAEEILDIFRELYEIEYPIEKMLLIDNYDADDLLSMADNNSSAFNYRFIEGTNRRSVHSDGLAIDINPLYNPYVRTREGKLEILPENASIHVDRDQENDYYIRKDDPCYKAFVSRGFTWGGEWKNSKDYQHFEKRIVD